MKLCIYIAELKCYVGTSGSPELTKCSSAMDRCVNVTSSGAVAFACNTMSVIRDAGVKDRTCTKVSNIKWCVCNEDGCNFATTQGTINIKLDEKLTKIILS